MSQQPLRKRLLMDRCERGLQPGVRPQIRVDRARVFERHRRGRTRDLRDGEEVFEHTGDTVGGLITGTTRRKFVGCLVNGLREEVLREGGQVSEFGEANVESGNVWAIYLAYAAK